MILSKRSAHDVLAGFIADIGSGKRSGDGPLEAVLLEHLLLQAGYKILPREPDELVLLAGAGVQTPAEVWLSMWDASVVFDPATGEGYTPA
jgi:hypothetical protein